MGEWEWDLDDDSDSTVAGRLGIDRPQHGANDCANEQSGSGRLEAKACLRENLRRDGFVVNRFVEAVAVIAWALMQVIVALMRPIGRSRVCVDRATSCFKIGLPKCWCH